MLSILHIPYRQYGPCQAGSGRFFQTETNSRTRQIILQKKDQCLLRIAKIISILWENSIFALIIISPMYNPFVLLAPGILDSLVRSGNGWFVRQTWAEEKGAYLISHYHDRAEAGRHYEAIGSDPYRKIYALSNPVQRQQLMVAAGQPEGYKIYTALLQDKWHPTGLIEQKIRLYLKRRLHWRPGRKDKVEVKLVAKFGELYIILKFQAREVSVSLADIESI